jgi:hypothetical protein
MMMNRTDQGSSSAVEESAARRRRDSYERGDGVPTGSYVVLFAELIPTPLMATKRSKGLRGPDGLMNLYNDPDRNKQDVQFKIDITPPGKSDYAFDLKVAGKEAATPGPHAVTEIK